MKLYGHEEVETKKGSRNRGGVVVTDRKKPRTPSVQVKGLRS